MKGRLLQNIIYKLRPKFVLEIGTLVGYSAILIAKELGEDAHLVTVEIDADEAEIAKENIRRAGMLSRAEVLVGDAIEIIPRIKGRFDLIFIDATKEEYLRYLKLLEDKLHPGSAIVADNAGISADRMKNYLEYVRYSERYRSRYVAVSGDGFEISTMI
ncbi:MAG: O-methyltransferase [Thermoproteota archaeon]